jgi:hypothetical protein
MQPRCPSCPYAAENTKLKAELAAYSDKALVKRERNCWFVGTLCVYAALIWGAAHLAWVSGNLVLGFAALIGLPGVSYPRCVMR